MKTSWAGLGVFFFFVSWNKQVIRKGLFQNGGETRYKMEENPASCSAVHVAGGTCAHARAGCRSRPHAGCALFLS